MKIIEELKRRKVFRVAAMYAVVGWVLAQVAAFAVETFSAPQWVQQIFVVFLALGFPLAIILAWAYELSPDGLKADASTPAVATIPAANDRKLIYATFILVLLAVGFQLADRFVLNSNSTDSTSSAELATTSSSGVLRSSLLLDQPLSSGDEVRIRSWLDISSDGSTLYYSNILQGSARQILARDLTTGETRQVEEANGTQSISLSPNERRLALGGGRTSMRILNLDDSPPLTINVRRSFGLPPAWLSDDELIYEGIEGLGILRKTIPNGEEIVVTQESVNIDHEHPHVLPGGEAFLFSIADRNNRNSADIAVHDLTTGDTKILLNGGYSPRYAASGHIIFVRSGNLLAVPFDLNTMEITGSVVTVVEGVSSQSYLGAAAFTFSDSGRLVYLPGEDSAPPSVGFVWEDRFGNTEDIGLPLGNYRDPELSPDGRTLALSSRQEGSISDIWVFDLSRQTLARRSFTEQARHPKWSPDGTKLVYTVDGQGIWMVNADGTGQAEQLTTDSNARPDSFTADGDLLYLSGAIGGTSIKTLSFSDGRWISQELIDAEFTPWGAAVSPDGRWISYVSIETGNQEIFVRPYPAVEDGKWQISTQTGREPRWSATGDELFFMQADGSLMSVSINTADGFTPGAPQVLIPDLPMFGADPPSFAVSNDKQRIIHYIATPIGAPEVMTAEGNAILTVVENWFEELRQLAPPEPE